MEMDYSAMRTRVLARGVFKNKIIPELNDPCIQTINFYEQMEREENTPYQLENELNASQLRAKRVKEIKERAGGHRVRHRSLSTTQHSRGSDCENNS